MVKGPGAEMFRLFLWDDDPRNGGMCLFTREYPARSSVSRALPHLRRRWPEAIAAEVRRFALDGTGLSWNEKEPELTGLLSTGDPIPPWLAGGMTGFIAGECGHRLAGSEWDAGLRNCERCGG